MGYLERSKGYKFYDPSRRSFFETGNAKFIEDSGSTQVKEVTFQEEYVNAPTTTTIEAIGDNQVPIPIIVPSVVVNYDIPVQLQIQLEAPPTRFEEPHQEIVEESQQPQPEVPIRRSTRERRKAISDDYVVFLQEHEFDTGLEDDPTSVNQAKQCTNSEKWIAAMQEEMKSMKDNDVWDLVELPKGIKPIGCK